MAKILIVDDDAEIREAMRIILESEGHQVTEADGADTCRQAITESRPDLLILDVMMETPDAGFQLSYELVQGEHRNMPILMVTGVGQATGFKFDPKKDEDFLPVTDYVEKPVSPQDLIKRVNSLLQKRRSE